MKIAFITIFFALTLSFHLSDEVDLSKANKVTAVEDSPKSLSDVINKFSNIMSVRKPFSIFRMGFSMLKKPDSISPFSRFVEREDKNELNSDHHSFSRIHDLINNRTRFPLFSSLFQKKKSESCDCVDHLLKHAEWKYNKLKDSLHNGDKEKSVKLIGKINKILLRATECEQRMN